MAMLTAENSRRLLTESRGKLVTEQQKAIQDLIDREKKAIQAKRRVTGDARWRPARGAGMMLEREWKKYQPESKKLTDYKK